MPISSSNEIIYESIWDEETKTYIGHPAKHGQKDTSSKAATDQQESNYEDSSYAAVSDLISPEGVNSSPDGIISGLLGKEWSCS